VRDGSGIAPAAAEAATLGPQQGNVAAIGRALFGPFTLPFEIASLLLLAAIIGTVVLGRRRSAGS
jgi:NADH-quinone oxidoreductase subunit J